MSFAIVEFTNGTIKEVEVIAKSWMKNDGKCFWPPFKSSSAIRKAVTSLQAPTSDWQIYPARVLYTTDFYEEARTHLEKAADTSNIETDTEDKRRTKQKRKMTMAFWDSDEDVEVSDKELKEYKRHHLTSSDNQSRMNLIPKISEILKPISTPCLKSEATNYPVAENTIDFSKANNEITSKLKLSSSELIENGAKIFCSEEEDRKQKQLSSQDFQKVVLNWIAKIDKKIDMLLQQQATTGISTPSPVPSDTIFERCLTKSDVDLLEEKVKANNVFKGRVLNVLSRSGGCSAYKSAFAIGKLLMSEEAGSCFNVSGGLFKTNFKTYTLYQLIVDAIMRQHHNAKVTECHSGISEFLRQSGTRHNRKGLKMNHVANSEPSSKG